MKVCQECNARYQDWEQHTCPEEETYEQFKSRDPLIGTRIADRYEVMEILGRGGMGVVYKGRQILMDRLVAIKMLHAHLITDASALQRFKQEAQAVSKVKHPHTVTLYDFGVTGMGQPYLVMDFIEGRSLRHIVRNESPLPLPRVHHIFAQVVDALTCAHQAGVIHRDLKPENIMLSNHTDMQDYVEVVDFGISTMATGPSGRPGYDEPVAEARGSPPYMSPEQCLMMPIVDQRSDIYSLGIVLFETLSGRLPYTAKNALEMLDCHVSVAPISLRNAHPNLAACESLSSMIAKSLEKDPKKRQQTIEDFGLELLEAVKKDTTRLRSLKNRPELQTPIGNETSQEMPVLPPQVVPDEGPANISDRLFHNIPEGHLMDTLARVRKITDEVQEQIRISRGESQQSSGQHDALERSGRQKTFIDRLIGIFRGDKDDNVSAKYVFFKCPHCGEQVDEKISFCLGCGRSLASTQDFSKVRAAQGVFTLPKSHESVSGPIPVFSSKARALSREATIWQRPSTLMMLGFLIVMAVFFFAGGASIISRAYVHLKEVVGNP